MAGDAVGKSGNISPRVPSVFDPSPLAESDFGSGGKVEKSGVGGGGGSGGNGKEGSADCESVSTDRWLASISAKVGSGLGAVATVSATADRTVSVS